MAKSNSTAAPINPLIDTNTPRGTLDNVKGVIWFLEYTVPGLLSNGSTEDVTHGLTMILQCAEQAMDHACEALQPKGVKHA
jgi:hypothetical protein